MNSNIKNLDSIVKDLQSNGVKPTITVLKNARGPKRSSLRKSAR